MLKNQASRLVVNVNDLRQFNRDLATVLLQQPVDYLPVFEKSLKEVVQDLNDPSFNFEISSIRFHVGLEGSFGELHTNPRHLSSRLLSHMVCLDGIVTSCSLVRPKLLKSVHYSDSMRSFLVKEYWDSTMLTGMQLPGSMSYPTEGEDKQKLTSEFGLSQYRDYQTISIQEMPEKAPAGQLPRSIDVIVDDDLVDQVKPGDRAQIVGVYKSMASAYNGQVPSTFRAVVIANHIRHLNRDSASLQLSDGDRAEIRRIAKRRDAFDLISRSLAPSIYGHEYVKKAVALMLLGGVEKNIRSQGSDETDEAVEGAAASTHIRGDINLMLVGDPSTAKSQMLRFVLGIAPLAIATTGRGSSGVGLTAAVTSDKETGERRLEAGAMVLADRGIVCIDEFDKMSDADRVAIHEVMEQQTVTIAKAGIHASLNARCSVLAAANPIWGQYRETASPQENIRLPDSLLSRFDLLFIILDRNAPEHDRHISQHVLKMHRYTPPGLPEGSPIPENILMDEFDEEEEERESKNSSASSAATDGASSIFQRRYTPEGIEDGDDDEILTIPFIKKYIHYAKSTCTPVLSKRAVDVIVSAYTEFRQKKEQAELEASSSSNGSSTAKTFPVTPRTLETLIRLATAHAKARLSPTVDKKDAILAQELIQFCLYQEVKQKPSKRSKKASTAVQDSESESESEDEVDDDSSKTTATTSKTATSKTNKTSFDEWDPKLAEVTKSITNRRREMQATREASEFQQLAVADEFEFDEKSPMPTTSQLNSQSQLPIASQQNSASLPVASTPATLSVDERARFRATLLTALRKLNESGCQSFTFAALLDAMSAEDLAITVAGGEPEMMSVLAALLDENKVFFDEQNIYII